MVQLLARRVLIDDAETELIFLRLVGFVGPANAYYFLDSNRYIRWTVQRAAIFLVEPRSEWDKLIDEFVEESEPPFWLANGAVSQ